MKKKCCKTTNNQKKKMTSKQKKSGENLKLIQNYPQIEAMEENENTE